jgi:hypothetical protein
VVQIVLVDINRAKLCAVLTGNRDSPNALLSREVPSYDALGQRTSDHETLGFSLAVF